MAEFLVEGSREESQDALFARGPAGAGTLTAYQNRREPLNDFRVFLIEIAGFRRVAREVVELACGLSVSGLDHARRGEPAAASTEDQLPVSLADGEHPAERVMHNGVTDSRWVIRREIAA